jgi:threonine/homoserine/homoserine lactone efflux protein
VPSPTTLALFSLAALALLAVPGPAVLYIVSQSLARGRRAGLASMLGIETGSLVHVVAAVVGLSALLASSASAFTAVKYVGAAYLVALGLLRLFRRAEPEAPATAGGARLRPLFFQGVVVNVLNPKTALFFLAFLPQFVQSGRGPIALQIVVLGMLFLVLAVLSDGSYALLAGGAAERVRRSRRARSLSRYGSGSVLIGLGVAAAIGGGGRNQPG